MKRQGEIVPDTIVWISGATEGLGLGLARNQPYPNARIVNLSRRQHPDYETVRFDLAQPDTWDAVAGHFLSELRDFKGTRAIFIHNAYLGATQGFVGEVDRELYRKAVSANVPRRWCWATRLSAPAGRGTSQAW